jgi:hypothetical protein
MSEVISKVGIHCIGPHRDGYGAFLQTINAGGRRLSVVKCRDDFGAVDEPLQLWPDVLTIGAMTEWDDAGYNVIEAYNRILMESIKNPKIKYWEYFNERNGDWQQQADLYIALLPMLKAVGLRLCMFNCASGTPQYSSLDPVPYQEVARACKFALDGGYDALLGLHEYESEGGTIGRYVVLASYLQVRSALIPIVITEYGYETYPGTGAHMAMLQRNDALYMGDPDVIGCADWTLGGGGWSGSNYQRDLPAMAEYIANVAPVDPDPDDPPEPVEGESPNGAACAWRDYLIDASGAVWSLAWPANPEAGYIVTRNAEQFAGGFAESLTYRDSVIYATNIRSEVYQATAAGWERVVGEGR